MTGIPAGIASSSCGSRSAWTISAAVLLTVRIGLSRTKLKLRAPRTIGGVGGSNPAATRQSDLGHFG